MYLNYKAETRSASTSEIVTEVLKATNEMHHELVKNAECCGSNPPLAHGTEAPSEGVQVSLDLAHK